ncbi:hypothetical protein FACS1894166_10170 [Bacilli bacterium]|nr:hypothetical protein FACS1894166_10170 [Bacilli bacterium]
MGNFGNPNIFITLLEYSSQINFEGYLFIIMSNNILIIERSIMAEQIGKDWIVDLEVYKAM